MKFNLAFFILFLPLAGRAGTPPDNNLNAWVMYFGDHPVSKHWGIHLEGQVRRADAGTTRQQLLLRPAINYQATKNILLTSGYAYVLSYPYGDRPAVAKFPEHRFFEQMLIKHRTGKVKFQHRLRLEQRLVGSVPPAPDAEVSDWTTRNRFRYMLRADFALPKKSFGIALYDEPFVQFGANRGPDYLDQNRAYAALTYQLTATNRIEFGYLHQYLPQRSEHNHTLQLAWFSSTPLKMFR